MEQQFPRHLAGSTQSGPCVLSRMRSLYRWITVRMRWVVEGTGSSSDFGGWSIGRTTGICYQDHTCAFISNLGHSSINTNIWWQSLIKTAITHDIRTIKAIPTKISFVGAPAVGKTTILKMLQGKSVEDGRYLPTQGFDLGRIVLENHAVRLFDFGGQKAYIKHYLEQYLFGSVIVFVVTDSTYHNILATRELVHLIQTILGDDIQIAAIANKQDLFEHMDPNRIQELLRVQTYPFVAIHADNKSKLITVIKKELEIADARKIHQLKAASK
jgi:small GTP-binding protein